MTDVDRRQVVVDEANRAILYLQNHGHDTYKELLSDVLDGTAYDRAITKIDNFLNENDQVIDNCRGFRGGTGKLKTDAGLNTDYGDDAIRLLKDEEKIMQFGPGRGRAIVLIDRTQLPDVAEDTTDDEETAPERPADVLDRLLTEFAPVRGVTQTMAVPDEVTWHAGIPAEEAQEVTQEEDLILEGADLADDVDIITIKNMIETAAAHLARHIENMNKQDGHEEEIKQREARIAELEHQIEEFRLTNWR